MRIVANYGTSLLDYLNNDNKDVSNIFSSEINDSCLSAAARKTLEEKGYKLSNSTSASTDKTDNTYSSIRTTTDDLRSIAALLTNTKENSLFMKAETNKDTSEITAQVTDFVAQYNEMLTKMNKMGGEKNSTYEKELAQLIKENEDKLKKVGITAKSDGLLAVDAENLTNASLDDLKAVFSGDTSFADSVAKESIYVEANAISAMCTSTISNYSSSGTYDDSTLSNFLKSI